MILITNKECRSVRGLMDFYLNKNSAPAEIAPHLDICLDCQKIWGDNRRLKRFLKRAVESEPVPIGLAESIRSQIRNN